jgi:sigma-B regulation protein RsbU (phosphoserine phosphatase)
VLDVSGHGVAASLLAVTVTRMLSPSTSGDSFVLQTRDNKARQVVPPCEVATRLAKNFSIESTEQFITLFYAVYDTKTRELSYISAGHPGAIRVSAGSTPVILDGSGLPIGIGEKYEQQSVTLQSGDRLYLYSDGVTEAMDAERSLFGTDRLIKCLADSSGESLTHSIARVQAELVAWQAGSPSRDDISILAMECV